MCADSANPAHGPPEFTRIRGGGGLDESRLAKLRRGASPGAGFEGSKASQQRKEHSAPSHDVASGELHRVVQRGGNGGERVDSEYSEAKARRGIASILSPRVESIADRTGCALLCVKPSRESVKAAADGDRAAQGRLDGTWSGRNSGRG